MIFSTIHFNDDEPIYKQIERYIISAIENGELIKESKLPSTRECSKVLGISRNSVIIAYDNLESNGFVTTIKGKGTFVSKEVKNEIKHKEALNINWKAHFNRYGKICEEMDIIKTELPYKAGMISFKSIAPQEKFFDVEEFKKAFLEVLALEGEKLLNYGYAKGYRGLINYLKEYMAQKGVNMQNKDILITNGFTEGLDIVLSSLIEPGEVVLCEEPTHHTALKLMRAYGLQVEMVPMDKQGIKPDLLEETIKKHLPRLAYLIPSYHNPTGIVMSGERRRQVYDILKNYRIPIIEDGFNEELLYSSTSVAPIAAIGCNGNGVIYIGSLSKILFPGLRIGWIMGDKELIYSLESVKRARNIHTSFIDQAALMQYMKTGSFDKYLKKARKYYRDKYLFTLEEVKKYLPYEAIWGEGGLHIFIKLKANMNTRKLLEACYQKGVLFTPGDLFYADRKETSTLRLGFARLTETQITEGLKIIGETIQELYA